MAADSCRSLCGEKICNILEDYETKFDSYSGLCHANDNALGEMTVGETDTEEERINEDFNREIIIMVKKEKQSFL
jgi:hypothetical protein